jgi:glycosyltransferase involved in cell wall biosynthesis
MRIAYCTNVRLPSERAHGHQIAQVCAALSDLGHAVTVFAPFRRNPVTQDFHAYYGIDKTTEMRHLGSFDPINRFWLPGVLGLWTLNALLRKSYSYVLQKQKFDLLYTRVPALLETLLKTGIPVALELHRLPSRDRGTFVEQCKKCALVICLTSPMRDELVKWGMDSANVIVEGDAYDPALFAKKISQEQARKELKLDQNIPVIGYAGQLSSMGKSKGMEQLMGALTELHHRGLTFQAIIAGGPDNVRAELEAGLPADVRSKVRFLGFVAHEQVPAVLSASDVLVYPAPKSTDPYFLRDTSPLKLFEYMAAQRPIVSADLPPLRDAVDETCVFFCEPGDSAFCADAIELVLKDSSLAQNRAVAAHKRVQSHTWEARMKRIIERVTLSA